MGTSSGSALSCLLVQQPYASLIGFGRKRWEFRSYEAKKRGKIGIAASPSSVLRTRSPSLNRVASSFPRGVLLATANLVNCFYITAADLKKAMTDPVVLSIHGQEVITLDSPIGEPKEDVEQAANSSTWESYVWQLDEVKPLDAQIHVAKTSPSTWTLVNLDVRRKSL
jgi:hypothetical protein